MWIEKIINEKGIRYKYSERIKHPITNKWIKISVTLNSNNRHVQKEAVTILNDKFIEKTKTTADRKTENLVSLTLYEVLDEWEAYTSPTVKIRTSDNHKTYVKRIKKALSTALLFVEFTPVIAEKIVRELYYTEMLSYNYSKTMLTTIQRVMWYAKKAGYIDQIGEYNEIELKKRPTTAKELQKAANKFINHDELKECLRQLDGINHRLSLSMEFIALKGLRCCEMLALRIQDYDEKYLFVS